MLNTIIIDDELDAQVTLEHFLKTNCKNLNIVGIAGSVEEGVKLITTTSQKIDLVFLDIHMNDGTGFDLLEQLPSTNFKLVFTTAYDQYAVKAFKFNALDYLLKPIDPIELSNVVERIHKMMPKGLQQTEQIQSVIEAEKSKKLDKIAIPSVDEIYFVSLEDLIRCEASSNYTTLFLSTGKKIIAPKTLKEFDTLLSSDGFSRVHQSHLVNLNHIKQFNKSQNLIIMSDDSKVEVSRRKKTAFIELINMRKL
jgi:two-component system, LytTR family, response regulator